MYNQDNFPYGELEKIFVQFLCSEGAIFFYLENLKNHQWKHDRDSIIKVIEHSLFFIKDIDLINWSFQWSKTPEKEDYWEILDHKFRIYIKQTEFYKSVICQTLKTN